MIPEVHPTLYSLILWFSEICVSGHTHGCAAARWGRLWYKLNGAWLLHQHCLLKVTISRVGFVKYAGNNHRSVANRANDGTKVTIKLSVDIQALAFWVLLLFQLFCLLHVSHTIRGCCRTGQTTKRWPKSSPAEFHGFPVANNFVIASPCASVLSQTYFALCYILSSLCKTQWASSFSVFLCLFFAFILHSVTASIPCYHISPLFLASPEMHFCTVNICPSCQLFSLFLFTFLSISSCLLLVISMHTCIYLSMCQVLCTDLQEGQRCTAK